MRHSDICLGSTHSCRQHSECHALTGGVVRRGKGETGARYRDNRGVRACKGDSHRGQWHRGKIYGVHIGAHGFQNIGLRGHGDVDLAGDGGGEGGSGGQGVGAGRGRECIGAGTAGTGDVKSGEGDYSCRGGGGRIACECARTEREGDAGGHTHSVAGASSHGHSHGEGLGDADAAGVGQGHGGGRGRCGHGDYHGLHHHGGGRDGGIEVEGAHSVYGQREGGDVRGGRRGLREHRTHWIGASQNCGVVAAVQVHRNRHHGGVGLVVGVEQRDRVGRRGTHRDTGTTRN